MGTPSEITELVERFERNRDVYRSGSYNETNLREEFINPFFAGLGWDVTNAKGYAEAYKDVIHEDSIRIGSATKAPDYCFRIGGARKFFLEAKRPAVDIERDIHPAFQLRRYGWSAKLPLSILTDFEEFAVYDCRVRPVKTDKASTARVKYIQYHEYPQRWEEIAAIFSREAVLKGSFDKYAESGRRKKGTAEVDAAFLGEIEAWREGLARNIALRNPQLSGRELNFAVQRTIDRIIFLRICEDRGIETYGQLMGLQNGGEVYRRLVTIFERADERYNSGLFYFQREKGRADAPDELTPELTIDDKQLKEIIKKLYYPESPYEFSVLPADILGQVYEQFLGKVISLTKGHRAKVEDKPEVKKAGGVYYTPTYIVDYIVKNTVGKLLEGKTPAGAGKLKILDPACGSGSFLIGAYQYLLDWHLKYYREHEADKWATGRSPRIYEGPGGDWRLTTAERKRILLNNIYGVDIDGQAVEVTKLSLLLKVLEGESQASVDNQLRLFHERALPDLGQNIKCGNSLIGPDFYEHKQMGLFDEEETYRINAFDWQAEFPEVFKGKNPGFDAVIGNPPYIQLSMAAYYDKTINKYLQENYSSSMGRLNTFGLFIERVIGRLLRNGGLISFIVPNTLLTQEYYQGLRQQMVKRTIRNLTSYKYPVFDKAVVETIVFVLENKNAEDNVITITDCDNKSMTYSNRHLPQSVYLETHTNAFLLSLEPALLRLWSKIEQDCVSLGELANINQAIALKYDRSACLEKRRIAANYKPVLDGRNIYRYQLDWDGTYLAYDVDKIHSCKRSDIFDAPEKLFFRRVGERLIATYDDAQFYALNTLVVITLRSGATVPLKYLLGLFNSSLLNFYYLVFLKSTKKVFSEIQARQVARLPIYCPSRKGNDPAVARIIALVNQILDLHKRLGQVKLSGEKTVLERQIAAVDGQIDRLVYELYGLTDEEIKIVEEGNL